MRKCLVSQPNLMKVEADQQKRAESKMSTALQAQFCESESALYVAEVYLQLFCCFLSWFLTWAGEKTPDPLPMIDDLLNFSNADNLGASALNSLNLRGHLSG